jgi:hypothetical protein
MEDKAIEFLMSYIPNSTDDKIIDECVKAMLEFGHYVAEEQKKQCAEEAKLLINYGSSITNDELIYVDTYHDIKIEIDKDSILNAKIWT